MDPPGVRSLRLDDHPFWPSAVPQTSQHTQVDSEIDGLTFAAGTPASDDRFDAPRGELGMSPAPLAAPESPESERRFTRADSDWKPKMVERKKPLSAGLRFLHTVLISPCAKACDIRQHQRLLEKAVG